MNVPWYLWMFAWIGFAFAIIGFFIGIWLWLGNLKLHFAGDMK